MEAQPDQLTLRLLKPLPEDLPRGEALSIEVIALGPGRELRDGLAER